MTSALCRAPLVGGPVGALFVRRWSGAPRARWGIWRQETPTLAALLYETAEDMLGPEESPPLLDAALWR